ncbi:MAG: CoA transferase [Candidatus Binatia bacterium]|nr:CoA transferase [Candidatus Binatia bacterium]
MPAPSASGALVGRRILELADHKTAYCGKLFADMGADVLLIEPPGGDSMRDLPPFWKGKSDPNGGLWFLYANTSKRGITLDLETEEGRTRFLDLAASADAVIEGEAPGRLAALEIGWEALHARNRRTVLTSISGFGQTGPRRDWKSSDLVATALGGAAMVTGYADDPPVRLAGSHAHVMTATNAAGATMIALLHASRTGRGQVVDISAVETVAAVSHITGVGKWLDDGIIPKRAGTGLFASVPSGAYECTDGLVYLMVNRPAHWKGVARWVFEETGQEAILNPLWEGPSANRIEDRELIDMFIGELTAKHSVAEIYHQGQARHLALTPMQTASEVVADPQLAARKYFVDVDLGDGGALRFPGSAYRHEGTPAAIRRRPPTVGEHNDEVFAEQREEGPRLEVEVAVAQALEGLRVIEFSMGMAGPWIGRAMAWCGAEVIKVESKSHPDVTRQYVPPWAPELGVQSRLSPWFTDWNAGKRFVAVDLTNPDAVDLIKQVIATADVVVENFTPGVLEKLGLGWDELRRVKPDLVMFGTSGFGDDGPCRRYVTWGPNLEAASGLAKSSGFAHRPCAMTHFAYPDSVSAMHGLFAVTCALEHRRRTGEGQRVNLSQLEAMVSVYGDVMMEALAIGVDPERVGNRSRYGAPHGCYPCSGDDRWCAIAIFDDEGWRTLCRVAEQPEWAVDPRFATLADRLVHVGELEVLVSQWTANVDAYDLQDRLQAAGIAAGVVQNTEDQHRRDPQLAARGFFEEIDHKLKGKVVANGIPLGFTATPGRTPQTGSAVGEDNDYVFGELLGLGAGEVARLRAIGAVEDSDEPVPELP